MFAMISNCTDISNANKLKIDVNTESIKSLHINKNINELLDIIDNDNDSIAEIDENFTMEYHIPLPKCTKNNVMALIAIMDTIALKKLQSLLCVLFKSGTMKTMIHHCALPTDTAPTKLTEGKIMTTLTGKFKTTEVVTLQKIKLPEFDKTKTVHGQKALVFDMPGRYDIILDSDFLFKAGIEIKYSDTTVEWFEHTIPMRDPLKFDDDDFT